MADFSKEQQSEIQSLVDDAKESVRKELLGRFAKYIVGGALAILGLAALGLWTVILPWLKKEVGGVPSGVVIAMDDVDGCAQEGWSRAPASWSGKTLVAAAVDPNDKLFGYSKTGGAVSHSLSNEEMPRHSHSFVGTPATKGDNNGDKHDVGVGGSRSYGTHTPSGTISFEGEGKPHNNMSPYIALYFCKKD